MGATVTHTEAEAVFRSASNSNRVMLCVPIVDLGVLAIQSGMFGRSELVQLVFWALMIGPMIVTFKFPEYTPAGAFNFFVLMSGGSLLAICLVIAVLGFAIRFATYAYRPLIDNIWKRAIKYEKKEATETFTYLPAILMTIAGGLYLGPLMAGSIAIGIICLERFWRDENSLIS